MSTSQDEAMVVRTLAFMVALITIDRVRGG
jgi:hypothetical protein